MRIFIVFEEGTFFTPDFVNNLIKALKLKDKIVGGILITKVPESCDIERYIRKNWRKLYFSEILLLGIKKITRLSFSIFKSIKKSNSFYTVKDVLNHHKVDWFSVQNNINTELILRKIKKTNPDVIINSGSLIFRKKLLKIPKKGCLNRHSSLLPSFGGLWPVFHAVRLSEPIGVSAHMMEEKIDTGVVLTQKEILFKPGDTLYNLYEKTFNISSDLIIQALNKIRINDYNTLGSNYKNSYFSLPDENDWKQFRERGMRWI